LKTSIASQGNVSNVLIFVLGKQDKNTEENKHFFAMYATFNAITS